MPKKEKSNADTGAEQRVGCKERGRERERGRGESLGACPNTTGRGARRTPATGGQLHFSRNLRENANARGIWQQWPWSVAPILRVGFLVDAGSRLGRGWMGGRGKKGKIEGEGHGERDAETPARGGRGVAGVGRPGSFAGHAKQKHRAAAAATPDDRPRLYTGSPNPLIRVDSHDRLEGYPPTYPSVPCLPPSPHFQPTHHSLSSSRHPPRSFCPYSDSQHGWLTIPGLKIPAHLRRAAP